MTDTPAYGEEQGPPQEQEQPQDQRQPIVVDVHLQGVPGYALPTVYSPPTVVQYPRTDERTPELASCLCLCGSVNGSGSGGGAEA